RRSSAGSRRARPPSTRYAGFPSYQANPPGQQLLHHALLELASFGELGFQRGNLGVHVGEDSGDGFLFGFGGRERNGDVAKNLLVERWHSRSDRILQKPALNALTLKLKRQILGVTVL